MASSPSPSISTPVLSSAPILSVRIVSLDYYMSPPIPGLDVEASPFHGAQVKEIPVIRIYGATPAGQKTCLHVHRALPYLYIPFPEESLTISDGGSSYISTLMTALEKSLKVQSAPKKQHVHGCSLVRAKKLYGYHPIEELFLKIFFYYPHDLPRAATLLLGGAVLNKVFQPYESHIPYLLHFLVDYNLYGMGHIHLSEYKFRPPLPENFNLHSSSVSPCGNSFDSNSKTVIYNDSPQHSKIWLSSTISDSYRWDDRHSQYEKRNLVSRQTTAMLEADAHVDAILNEKQKVCMPLSQNVPGAKMVQSLLAIREELELSKMVEKTKPPEAGRPQAVDALRRLSNVFEYDHSLSMLPSEELPQSDSSKSDESEKLDNYIKSYENVMCTVNYIRDGSSKTIYQESLKDNDTGIGISNLSFGSSEEHGQLKSSEQAVGCFALKSSGCDTSSQFSNVEHRKLVDAEALGLLGWLASSQAMEECTDDDLINEVNLSPLLVKKSIQDALETAHHEFDNASQQECQDILDSVDLVAPEQQEVPKSTSAPAYHLGGSSYNCTIPQVDGSSDASLKVSQEDCCYAVSDDMEMEISSRSTSIGKSKIKRKQANTDRGNEVQWGSLPVSSKKKEHNSAKRTAESASDSLNSEPGDSDILSVNKVDISCSFSPQSERLLLGASTSRPISSCSVRDLMRRKRCFRPDYFDSESPKDDTNAGSPNDECLHMTFATKPPSVDQIKDSCDIILQDVDDNMALDSHLHSTTKGLDDIRPFFHKNYEYEDFQKDVRSEGRSSSDPILGIPTHFQNDGSALYLLTNAYSAPTVDSVAQWLSKQSDGSAIRGCSAGSASCKISSENEHSPVLSHCIQDDEELVVDQCRGLEEHIPDSKTGHESKIAPQVTDLSGTEFIKNQKRQNDPACSLHEFSQLSGGDVEGKSTPLSQLGFRDPASTGAGQQLTIISVEVFSECRGDLCPNPQFDAIKVVCLSVGDDVNPTSDLYELVHGDTDKFCKRSIGAPGGNAIIFSEEKHLLYHFISLVSSVDPDIIVGWEIQRGSLGYLAERAAYFGIGLLKGISRTPVDESKLRSRNTSESEINEKTPVLPIADGAPKDISTDDWGLSTGLHVGGRIVLNLWHIMRAEVKINMYNIETVADEVLRRKIPSLSCQILNQWFCSGSAQARGKCIQYISTRANLNLELMNQLDLINRTSELARVFGIDFFSVLSRGSQYRVESMLLRLAHSQNYLAISPGSQQVALQPAMECLPLVMEPESAFYADPVVVLDFQSLYPSMIIAYNLCYSTCLGKYFPSQSNVLGVSSYSADPGVFSNLKNHLLLTPNGVLYAQSNTRRGILPCLLEEILSTRIMVKQAMKNLTPSQQVLYRILNARQLALKLIANVTYGYTAAGFSGRMPCAELADSIVQCGRRTLESSIKFVNEHPKWKARVVYGDTDSMFVLLKDRSREEAFKIGKEISSAVTAMNPEPVLLKFEKVYHPCFLLTKKRYVGYSYESPHQSEPIFDAKGIETVRRDTCPAVAKILERSIRVMFEHQDIPKVRSYVERQWTRILAGKFSVQDFIFSKEVRLGTYSARATSLPPAALVATKAMAVDPRAGPLHGERIPYVVIHGEPGARLIDMVINPYDLLDLNSPYRLNDLYYIKKQINPALQRLFGLIGVNLDHWFSELPRPARPSVAKRHSSFNYAMSVRENVNNRSRLYQKLPSKGSRIDTYYMSKHCVICGDMIHAQENLCANCSRKEATVAIVMVGRSSKLDREIHHLAAICEHCGGADWIVETGVKCISLACPVFFERRKVQRELNGLSLFAQAAGYYPPCAAELF